MKKRIGFIAIITLVIIVIYVIDSGISIYNFVDRPFKEAIIDQFIADAMGSEFDDVYFTGYSETGDINSENKGNKVTQELLNEFYKYDVVKVKDTSDIDKNLYYMIFFNVQDTDESIMIYVQSDVYFSVIERIHVIDEDKENKIIKHKAVTTTTDYLIKNDKLDIERFNEILLHN